MSRYLAISAAASAVAVTVGGCGAIAQDGSPQHASDLNRPAAPRVHVAARPAPLPPGADPEARADGRVQAGGASCGRERWDVKTATDPQAGAIDVNPVDTTIAGLAGQPTSNPSDNPDQPRDNQVEMKTWRLAGVTVTAFKQEADSDIHLALADAQGRTMIAEIPDAPACTQPPVTQAPSLLETQIEQARAAAVQALGQPTGSYQTAGIKVTLEGVGFFDKIHGQRGVAPNGVELHPVTRFEVDG